MVSGTWPHKWAPPAHFWSWIPSWQFATWKEIPWGQKARLQTFAIPLLGQLTARCLGFVFIGLSTSIAISNTCLILDQVCKNHSMFWSLSSPIHLLISMYILVFPQLAFAYLHLLSVLGHCGSSSIASLPPHISSHSPVLLTPYNSAPYWWRSLLPPPPAFFFFFFLSRATPSFSIGFSPLPEQNSST